MFAYITRLVKKKCLNALFGFLLIAKDGKYSKIKFVEKSQHFFLYILKIFICFMAF